MNSVEIEITHEYFQPIVLLHAVRSDITATAKLLVDFLLFYVCRLFIIKYISCRSFFSKRQATLYQVTRV